LKKRNYFIPLLIVLFLTISLITLNIKGIVYPLSFLQKVSLSLFIPIQTKVIQGLRKIDQIWEHYFYLVNLKQNNEELRKQINQLRYANNRYIEVEKSYIRLLKLLELKDLLEFKTVAAQVVGRDFNGWFRILYIDKGSRDGIAKGMAVTAPEGLVGQVLVTAPSSAKVLLITDIRSSVAALIQRSRSSGIVIGSVNNGCKMKYLKLNADIKIGDRVISSGLGGVFPKGLFIGQVSRIYEGDAGFFLDAEITPGVNMDRLEEVLVIIRP
jgi:rod shape-determining protein MreC